MNNKKEIVDRVMETLETSNKRTRKRAEHLYDELAKKIFDEDDLIYEIIERLP